MQNALQPRSGLYTLAANEGKGETHRNGSARSSGHLLNRGPETRAQESWASPSNRTGSRSGLSCRGRYPGSVP